MIKKPLNSSMQSTIRALIVDDEAAARDVLANLLGRFCPQIFVVQKCGSVPEAVAAIREHQPDVVFLDIEMPQYAGYEIVSFFDKVEFEIVFITAYDKFAVKAFELSAVDYLLKPISISRLQEALKKLEKKISEKSLQNSYQILVESLQNASLKKIVIPQNGDQIVLETASIVAIEADNAYSRLHILDGNTYLVSRNLKYYESMLEDNPAFFRAHKSWLVNTDHLVQYSKSEMEIHLIGGVIAKLSKYKKTDFEDLLRH